MQLVLQSPDLLELAPIVFEQPRVVKTHGGMRCELLHDLDRPPSDRVAAARCLDHQHAQPEPTREEERHDQEVACVRDQRARAADRTRGRADERAAWNGVVSARSTTRSIPAGRRVLVDASRGEEHQVVHGRSEHEAPVEGERIVEAVQEDARHLARPNPRRPARPRCPVSAVISARLRRRFRSFTAESAAVAMVTAPQRRRS